MLKISVSGETEQAKEMSQTLIIAGEDKPKRSDDDIGGLQDKENKFKKRIEKQNLLLTQ